MRLSDGGCGGGVVGCRQHQWTVMAMEGDRLNNSGWVREDGGESSEIVDYSVESCRKIL